MARSLRDIRRKMKAIKSTKQITKAMELVSASKMRKAVQQAETLRQYAFTAWGMLQKLAEANPGVHAYFTQRPIRKVLGIVITSDRGLSGSLNAQLFRSLSHYLSEFHESAQGAEIDFIAVGRKGQQFLARTGQKVIAAFPAFSNHPRFREVLPVAHMATDGFQAGTYDHVVLFYSNFLSALAQEPTVKPLLPFTEDTMKTMLERAGLQKSMRDAPAARAPTAEYLLEPSADVVLREVLPKLTEVQIYQGVLEAAASEHSARMVAMRNASDNASDIIDDLTLTYNQTRQANITAELAELSASKAALD